MKLGPLALLSMAMVAGCVTQPANDWEGGSPFQLSNEFSNARINANPSSWPISYAVTGVYKVDRRNHRIVFRIDKLAIKVPAEKFGPHQVKSLQVGYCYFTHGDIWHMNPVPTVTASNQSPKVEIVVDQLDKVYSKVNIASVSVPIGDAADITKAWPCSALWDISKGSLGFVPAHQKELRSIE
jgi:hypothetical protein